MPVETKKLVEAHLLSSEDREDTFEKGCALIQANLGMEPTVLDEEEWAARYAQALWVEQWRMKNLAELMAALFGERDGGKRRTV